jgi:hypothetical protein
MMNEEIKKLFDENPEVEVRGLECWGNEEKFHRWLLGETYVSKQLCGGRVIDLTPDQILGEIHAIEHGLFF